MRKLINILIIALAVDCAIVLALLVADKIAQPFIILYWALLLIKNTCDYIYSKRSKR